MITVHGASDDLIEISGDIREEFYAYGTANDPDAPLYLAFSEGTILRIVYSDSGVWRITPVVCGEAHLNIEPAPENDMVNYSDRATLLDSAISWVVLGTHWKGV